MKHQTMREFEKLIEMKFGIINAKAVIRFMANTTNLNQHFDDISDYVKDFLKIARQIGLTNKEEKHGTEV